MALVTEFLFASGTRFVVLESQRKHRSVRHSDLDIALADERTITAVARHLVDAGYLIIENQSDVARTRSVLVADPELTTALLLDFAVPGPLAARIGLRRAILEGRSTHSDSGHAPNFLSEIDSGLISIAKATYKGTPIPELSNQALRRARLLFGPMTYLRMRSPAARALVPAVPVTAAKVFWLLVRPHRWWTRVTAPRLIRIDGSRLSSPDVRELKDRLQGLLGQCEIQVGHQLCRNGPERTTTLRARALDFVRGRGAVIETTSNSDEKASVPLPEFLHQLRNDLARRHGFA